MTFWMKDGKVVVDGSGKPILCDTCPCGLPVDCCLYPWPDPTGTAGGPYYTDTDLPSAIVYDGHTLTKVSGQYKFSDGTITIEATSSEWTATGGGYSDASPCLIAPWPGANCKDQFASSYTLHFTVRQGGSGPTDTRSVTMTRVALCHWRGQMDGINCDLYYDSSLYKWVIYFQSEAGCVWVNLGDGGLFLAKELDQTDPTGTYDIDGSGGTATKMVPDLLSLDPDTPCYSFYNYFGTEIWYQIESISVS